MTPSRERGRKVLFNFHFTTLYGAKCFTHIYPAPIPSNSVLGTTGSEAGINKDNIKCTSSQTSMYLATPKKYLLIKSKAISTVHTHHNDMQQCHATKQAMTQHIEWTAPFLDKYSKLKRSADST